MKISHLAAMGTASTVAVAAIFVPLAHNRETGLVAGSNDTGLAYFLVTVKLLTAVRTVSGGRR
ncbi:MAG: hypothetical protein MI749_11595 [Desulfovibrionales bacterium]|nr:hypothetical protein [Desulfovibrionales bacterium]